MDGGFELCEMVEVRRAERGGEKECEVVGVVNGCRGTSAGASRTERRAHVEKAVLERSPTAVRRLQHAHEGVKVPIIRCLKLSQELHQSPVSSVPLDGAEERTFCAAFSRRAPARLDSGVGSRRKWD